MPRIKILIADDQRLLRTALADSLSQEPDLEVAGTAANGREAMEAALRLRPDVVLLDVRMPEQDGITAARDIKGRLPRCGIIMMTVLEEQEYLERAILAGADGYLLKEATRDELVEAIRRVHRGESLIDPAFTRAILETYRKMRAGQPTRPTYPDGLTRREAEILRLVAQGYCNHEIAERAHVALGTVKMHLHRAFQKIGARDRTQAALYVLKKDL